MRYPFLTQVGTPGFIRLRNTVRRVKNAIVRDNNA